MTYNLTGLQTSTNLYDLFSYANTSTDGTLIITLILSIFFIMLFVLKKWEFQDALISSSFVTFILAALLSYAKLLNIIFPLAFLAITAFTILFTTFIKKD